MSENLSCPNCKSEATYADENRMVCTQCFHEWIPESETAAAETTEIIRDANGNELKEGDTVIIMKDLPVKGASKSLKAGTKVKNIRFSEGDHNLSCRIEGIGAMGLKSEFVRKA